MPITFRPDVKHKALLESLTERNERSKFINLAIDHYVSMQPVLDMLNSILLNQQEMKIEIAKLSLQFKQLGSKGIEVYHKQQQAEVTSNEEESKELNYLFSGASEIFE